MTDNQFTCEQKIVHSEEDWEGKVSSIQDGLYEGSEKNEMRDGLGY
jgi:hypothetical protein